MVFPAILSPLQPFQICIFNRKNSELTFSNGPQLMGKRFMANLHASLDSTCNFKWPSADGEKVHGKFAYISTRCQIPWGGVHSTTCDPKLRNEDLH